MKFILWIHIIHSVICIGEKAFQACKEAGLGMPECHNILNPDHRVRVPIDTLMFPHMVLLGYRNNITGDVSFKCGGTILSESWVLTAAHCIMDVQLGQVATLRVGFDTFEFSFDDEQIKQDVSVARVVTHPGYTPSSKYNDIALLQAALPFKLGKDIRIACINTNASVVHTKGTVIGFGTTKSDEHETSPTLLKVDVDIIDRNICNASFQTSRGRRFLNRGVIRTQLCAGDMLYGGRDTCQGDSGGPLNVLHQNVDCVKTFPLYYVEGVTSFGRHCGFKRNPGIYTNVLEYLEWIEKIVWT